MNIGCLFGTFDPPHRGHLSIAGSALRLAGLDVVWLVVTPQNPFKKDKHITPDTHRLAMVRLLVKGVKGLHACAEEMQLPAPNRTADTLAHFRSKWPEHHFSLIVGADNLLHLHTWSSSERIIAHHPIIVYPRTGSPIDAIHPSLARASITTLDQPLVTVSATSIRADARTGATITDRTTPAVASYIMKHRLYAG